MRSSIPPGCLALAVLGLVLLLPLFLADVIVSALATLGFSPRVSLLIALGIFAGGLINVPVKKIPREEEVDRVFTSMFGLGRLMPVRRQSFAVLAVNVGGCLIPGAVAVYELVRASHTGSATLIAALGAVAINVAVCYRLAKPVPEVGITLPAFVPALAAAACGLLFAPAFAPPVAFAAGVLGPLVGADLLHLRDIEKISTGMVSIGGAGTFDGIVLSSVIATLLA